jgi:hypothetical protein
MNEHEGKNLNRPTFFSPLESNKPNRNQEHSSDAQEGKAAGRKKKEAGRCESNQVDLNIHDINSPPATPLLGPGSFSLDEKGGAS